MAAVMAAAVGVSPAGVMASISAWMAAAALAAMGTSTPLATWHPPPLGEEKSFSPQCRSGVEEMVLSSVVTRLDQRVVQFEVSAQTTRGLAVGSQEHSSLMLKFIDPERSSTRSTSADWRVAAESTTPLQLAVPPVAPPWPPRPPTPSKRRSPRAPPVSSASGVSAVGARSAASYKGGMRPQPAACATKSVSKKPSSPLCVLFDPTDQGSVQRMAGYYL